jgi:hypothetical protein
LDNTNLVHLNLDQLPASQIGSDDQFADLVKDTDKIGCLCLYEKGMSVNKKLIGRGNYGIPTSGEKVIDLGNEINIIPFARRPKAIDMSSEERLIVSYDPKSDVFIQIVEMTMETESHCMYGSSFLVFECSAGHFLEFFCGSKSSRTEAANIYPYLPLTQADIDAKLAAGEDVSNLKAHCPSPLTLTSQMVEKNGYPMRVPVVTKCNKVFTNLPTMDEIVKEMKKFIAVKDSPPAICSDAVKPIADEIICELIKFLQSKIK